MCVLLEEDSFGPLINWRMARLYSAENGGPVTPDQVGLAAVQLQRYIEGSGLQVSEALTNEEAALLEADVDEWYHRRDIKVLADDAEYWGDYFAESPYDYDVPVFLDDWARASRFFW